jgi:hypothetical protein
LDRAVEPFFCHVAEPKAVVRLNLLAAATTSKKLIAERTSGGDPAINSAPPLLPRTVPEPDLVHAGLTLVDVALDTDASAANAVA